MSVAEKRLDEEAPHRPVKEHQVPHVVKPQMSVELERRWLRPRPFTTGGAIAFAFVCFASFGTRLIWIGNPSSCVFDEVYFGDFAHNYVNRDFYFDIHPPFAKLQLGAVMYLTGFNSSFPWKDIGQEFPDGKYIYLRMLNAVYGAGIGPLAYLTTWHFTGSVMGSLFAGMLVVYDIGFLVESKFVFTDGILFFWIALALHCNVRFWAETEFSYGWYKWLIYAGLSLGGAVAVKWTGLCVVGCVGIYHAGLVFQHLFDDLYRKVDGVAALRTIARAVFVATSLFTLMGIVYIGSWYVHVTVLTNCGPGYGYQTSRFQATLNGRCSEHHDKTNLMGFWEKFVELHDIMYQANSSLRKEHHWQSYWKHWPIMERNIGYWVYDNRWVNFMGNPIVWWLVGIMMLLYLVFVAYVGSMKVKPNVQTENVLWAGRVCYLGYMINFLPYHWVYRCVFSYHYLPSLYFGMILSGCLWGHFVPDNKLGSLISAVALAALGYTFYYWAPFAYGITISNEEYNSKLWYEGWK